MDCNRHSICQIIGDCDVNFWWSNTYASQVVISKRSSKEFNLMNRHMFDIGICWRWFYFGIELIYRLHTYDDDDRGSEIIW